jgi:hypothetical protein
MVRTPVNPMSPQEAATRRRGVLRTVWVVAGIALAVYVGFLLLGVLGK